VRRQICVEPDSLASACGVLQAGQRVEVNGRWVAVIWDLAHPLRDEADRQILGRLRHGSRGAGLRLCLGQCRVDREPPELERSTVAHEFGHVLFDVPAALHTATRRFRAGPPILPHSIAWRCR